MTRERLASYLGDLPPADQPPRILERKVQQLSWAVREDLLLDLNGLEPVPGVIYTPLSAGPHPLVICEHAHGGAYEIGKRELSEGIPYMQNPPYAEVLTSLGFTAASIDAWGFGSRKRTGESKLFKYFLWKGSSLWGMMVHDTLRFLDLMLQGDTVQQETVGIMGMSMGSTKSWWCAALDQRFSFCIDICCLTDFDELISTDGLDRHGLFYYVPGLLKEFTAASINALTAPRRHFSLAGARDPLTPLKGLKQIDRELRKAYRKAGAPEAWQLKIYDAGHEETPQMRRDITAYLEGIQRSRARDSNFA